MQTITPFLWFDDNLEEAVKFYTSVFKDSKAGEIRRTPDGKVFGANWEVNGQKFMGLNGGPAHANFSETISFFVKVETQEEVDELWEKLTADGGEESQCGWLKDKFGLSWQIIPTALERLMGDSDPGRSQRAMQAMLKMKKLDIAELERAADGK